MANIIIKDRTARFGKTRSEQAENLKKEWGCGGLTDEQIDKCKHLEKKLGLKHGLLKQSVIDSVK